MELGLKLIYLEDATGGGPRFMAVPDEPRTWPPRTCLQHGDTFHGVLLVHDDGTGTLTIELPLHNDSVPPVPPAGLAGQ